MDGTGMLDADRSGWDESDLVLQVAEHLRPLDPRVAVDLRAGRLDRLAKRAAATRASAPFDRPAPYGRSARDRRLRRYAACFGMSAPARLEPDRPRTAVALAEALVRIARENKPRASVVHVVAPPVPEGLLEQLAPAVRRLRARGVRVRWSPPPLGCSVAPELGASEGGEEAARWVERAVHTRAAVAEKRGEAALRRLGVKVVRVRRGRRSALRRAVAAAVDGARSHPAEGQPEQAEAVE